MPNHQDGSNPELIFRAVMSAYGAGRLLQGGHHRRGMGEDHSRPREGSRKAGSTLIDCRRGASNGVRRGPGLIVLRRSMKSRTIGGVRWGSRHGDTGQSAKQDR
jgi:hypothetical protein